MSISTMWHRTPIGTKVGSIVAILGFIVTVSSYNTTAANGIVTSCSYADFGALAAAAVTTIAAVYGVVQNPRRHENLRLSNQVLVPVSVVLLAVAVVHVFRGLGTIGGKC